MLSKITEVGFGVVGFFAPYLLLWGLVTESARRFGILGILVGPMAWLMLIGFSVWSAVASVMLFRRYLDRTDRLETSALLVFSAALGLVIYFMVSRGYVDTSDGTMKDCGGYRSTKCH